jgi:hypothetical protein
MTLPRNRDAVRLTLEWFRGVTFAELLRAYEAGEFSWNELWSYTMKMAERDGASVVVDLVPATMLREFLNETETFVGIAPDRLLDLALPPFQNLEIFRVMAQLLRERLSASGGEPAGW